VIPSETLKGMGRKDKGSGDKKRDSEEAAAAPKQKKPKQAAKEEEEEHDAVEEESEEVEDLSEGDEGEVGDRYCVLCTRRPLLPPAWPGSSRGSGSSRIL
jgi:hypothetical protein